MPTTDAIPGRAALCRPAASLLALVLSLAPAPAVLAQNQGWATAPPPATPRITDDDIVRMVDEGMRALTSGDLDTAYAHFLQANEITFESVEFGLTAKHLPNLALARYAMVVGDWPELGRFAASVATALELEGYRDHPYRIEAMTFQGLAAYLDNRLNEADLLLRAALAASEGRAELAITRDLAQFYLAATAYQLSSPDASEIRRAYLDSGPVPGSYVSVEDVAFMYYVEMFASRAEGGDPAFLAADYAGFLDGLDDLGQIDPVSMSNYRGFLGVLQSQAGQIGAARAAFEARHTFLLENGLIDDEFLFNVERLAMSRHNMGETRAAYDFLARMMAFARTRGLETGVYAVFEQDMGTFQDSLGDAALAQAHYRRAYAILRETRTLTDRQVLVLRPLIDLNDPGFAGFALADELRATSQAPLILLADGTSLLSEFFQAGYLKLEDRLWQSGEANGADTPVHRLNRALYLALLGQRDAALVDLEAMRAADPDMADLVELVARVWGADDAAEEAGGAVARLEARFADLPPPRQSACLALAVFQAYRLEDLERVRALSDRWLVVDAALPDRADPWHRMASAMMIEVGMAILSPDTADRLWEGFQRDTATLPALPLLRDYGRLMYLANAPDALAAPDAVVELSGLLRRMQNRLPPYHALISATQFSLASAFQWVGDTEQALGWMDRTATTLRAHPFHDRDTLAFALSEQSRLMLVLGRVDQAALIAAEAYGMIDLPTARKAYVGRIVSNYADALFQRTDDRDRVAGFYGNLLNDPAYIDRISPDTRAIQLLSYANMLSDSGTWGEVRDVLDRAEAIFARDDGFDRRGWLAQVNLNHAVAEWQFDQGDLGFARIRRANALFDAVRQGLISAGGATGETVQGLRNQATWTALIGWDYAQTLDD